VTSLTESQPKIRRASERSRAAADPKPAPPLGLRHRGDGVGIRAHLVLGAAISNSTRSSLETAVDNRPLYYRDGLDGRDGNWVDGTSLQGTNRRRMDENRHLAKLGVAGSNPSSAPKKDQVTGLQEGRQLLHREPAARAPNHNCTIREVLRRGSG
jgi:hypothetical protein